MVWMSGAPSVSSTMALPASSTMRNSAPERSAARLMTRLNCSSGCFDMRAPISSLGRCSSTSGPSASWGVARSRSPRVSASVLLCKAVARSLCSRNCSTPSQVIAAAVATPTSTMIAGTIGRNGRPRCRRGSRLQRHSSGHAAVRSCPASAPLLLEAARACSRRWGVARPVAAGPVRRRCGQPCARARALRAGPLARSRITRGMRPSPSTAC